MDKARERVRALERRRTAKRSELGEAERGVAEETRRLEATRRKEGYKTKVQ